MDRATVVYPFARMTGRALYYSYTWDIYYCFIYDNFFYEIWIIKLFKPSCTKLIFHVGSIDQYSTNVLTVKIYFTKVSSEHAVIFIWNELVFY